MGWTVVENGLAGDRHRSILKLFAIARCARLSPFPSPSLFVERQKTALLLGCVRPTQCLLYNSIESYSTHELLKIRARIAERSDATRRWESECNTTTAAPTTAIVTATAIATAVRILHTYKASAAAAAAVQPGATTATVAVAVAAVQSASICVDHL